MIEKFIEFCYRFTFSSDGFLISTFRMLMFVALIVVIPFVIAILIYTYFKIAIAIAIVALFVILFIAMLRANHFI